MEERGLPCPLSNSLVIVFSPGPYPTFSVTLLDAWEITEFLPMFCSFLVIQLGLNSMLFYLSIGTLAVFIDPKGFDPLITSLLLFKLEL
jgi:hypothetical protein